MSAVKDFPILFSGPLIRPIQADTKTQTRRVIARPLQHPGWTTYRYFGPSANNPTCTSKAIECGPDYPDDKEDQVLCPYGAAGDRLWVRETYFAWGRWETRFSSKKRRDEWHFVDMTMDGPGRYHYAADGNATSLGLIGRRATGVMAWWKRPAIFMPRAACRITLEITEVRVERLQDISEADAKAEGVEPADEPNPLRWQHYSPHGVAYRVLWDQINGAGSWEANPWVWAVSFRRLHA